MEETFTFSNGRTVRVQRVSQLLLRTMNTQFPSPEPPVVKTELGEEENYMDPDYLVALGVHRQLVGEKLLDLLILRGVLCEIDVEAVKQLRADMKSLSIELESNDKIVYIRNLCVTDADDVRKLQQAILIQGQPTEEGIQKAAEEFKS